MCCIISALCMQSETSHAYQEHYQTIIIGSGPGGLTAGIYLGRSNIKTLILEGKNPGGTLVNVANIGNWPGETQICGADLMIKMRDHALQAGCILRGETALNLTVNQRPFTITTHTGSVYTADTVILAIGLTLKKLGCPGEKDYWGKGVAACALCEGPLCSNKKVVIVGGGKMALENAILLKRYTNDITILNPEAIFEGPQDLIAQVEALPIKILHNYVVTKVSGDDARITSIHAVDTATKKIAEFPVDELFVSLGLKPHVNLVAGKLALTSDNKIKVDKLYRTSVEGIWAAGSATDFPFGQAVICASAGCIAALDIEKYLNKHKLSNHLTQTKQGHVDRKDKKSNKNPDDDK